jgi:peptidoglycan/xylan/chitin deacetylase (PgdA/CDA1 family)
VRSVRIKKVTPVVGRREMLRLSAAFLLGVPLLPDIVRGSWLFPPDWDIDFRTGKKKIGNEDAHANPEVEDLVAGPKTPGSLFLTFDDGPLDCTASILDHLAANKQKTTFFVVGRNLANESLRKLAIRAVREGHELGNHSYTHPSFSKLSGQKAEKEIRKTHKHIEQVVAEAGGNSRKQNRFFRFPYGDAGSVQTYSTTRKVLKELGYRIAWWDVDPRDWQMCGGPCSRSASRVIASVTKAAPRDIVLLHDRTRTAAILSSVLGALGSKNLASLPLSEYDSAEKTDKKTLLSAVGKPISNPVRSGRVNRVRASTTKIKGRPEDDPDAFGMIFPGESESSVPWEE